MTKGGGNRNGRDRFSTNRSNRGNAAQPGATLGDRDDSFPKVNSPPIASNPIENESNLGIAEQGTSLGSSINVATQVPVPVDHQSDHQGGSDKRADKDVNPSTGTLATERNNDAAMEIEKKNRVLVTSTGLDTESLGVKKSVSDSASNFVQIETKNNQ